jgi:hypothetical protein
MHWEVFGRSPYITGKKERKYVKSENVRKLTLRCDTRKMRIPLGASNESLREIISYSGIKIMIPNLNSYARVH